MGAGKSTGARSLAAELGGQALDSDRELEHRIGEPIESYFDRLGEAAFREREEEVVCELLARDDAPVIALGGGAIQSERVRDALTRHTVSYSARRSRQSASKRAGSRASGRPFPDARRQASSGSISRCTNVWRVSASRTRSDWIAPPP